MDSTEILKGKIHNFILNSSEYRAALRSVCIDIVNQSKTAKNEATVASTFEIELYAFIKEYFNIKSFPEKEKSVTTERHIAKGRIDSKYSGVIIEYKHSSKFNSEKKKRKATKQICEYLSGLFKEDKNDYVGFVTDGIECQIIELKNGVFAKGAYCNLKANHLSTLVQCILSLSKVALTPENLVNDFTLPLESSLANQLTHTLYDTLRADLTKKTSMLFNEWKELFRLAHDDKSKQKAIKERTKALEVVLDRKLKGNKEIYLALYALQTTYAIIVKIIAYKVLTEMHFNKSLIQFNQLAQAPNKTLELQMQDLEGGAIFRNLGIGNLLEGDYFAWYSASAQWNDNIGNHIKEIYRVLTPYEDKKIFDNADSIGDLFKDLYMSIIPEKVRHSLGEYYTPPWLADNLVDGAIAHLDSSHWRGLDPCAGSGTFLSVLIRKVLESVKEKPRKHRLEAVLDRVKGIDLNPLAVLTARINYFINISHLISETDEFDIPVYLGDSSIVPSSVQIEQVPCFSYSIHTIKGVLQIVLPKSIVNDPKLFSKTMLSIEDDIHNLQAGLIVSKLLAITPHGDHKPEVISNLNSLAAKFVELEKSDWNGIWARVVTNFLTTATLGRFDIVVGNPPWIDWKNLPQGYRERIKSLCIDRHLFSGDGRTGGINLNVCALISNVCAQNWLKDKGVLAFLMPQSLLFQQTYEGFREFKLDDSKHLYLQEIFDWTKAGHPFKPVQQKFLSYFYSNKKVDYTKGIPVIHYNKSRRNEKLSKYNHTDNFRDIQNIYSITTGFIGQVNPNNTIFTYADDIIELNSFKKIVGETEYIGREGIEFYPQEIFLLEVDSEIKRTYNDKVFVKNFQSSKSLYKVPQQSILLETKYLRPLVKGTDIKRYHISTPRYIVPFPYGENNRSPVPIKELSQESKHLVKYFNKHKDIILSQTNYNSKIIGNKHNKEFYALARVGEYSFGKHYVVFRDNTKWQAAVVSTIETPWGEKKRPQYQNHAVSICQDKTKRFITLDEAHYICAAFNAPLTAKYIHNSSDTRTFKIRPQINVPKYNKKKKSHRRLAVLSLLAHNSYADEEQIKSIDLEINKILKMGL